MTTSILKPEAEGQLAAQPTHSIKTDQSVYRIAHTLPSRFALLLLCTSIVLSALAYGTVHYWTLAIFSLGALSMVALWVADGWKLGSLRISRNPLQLPLLAALLLGLIQLLPFRPADVSGLPHAGFRSISLDPYSTRMVLVQLIALTIYFAAALVFTDTPRRLRLLVRTIIVFGFFLAIFGLTQSFTTPNRVYWVRELTQSTAFGPFINRHHFAGYMELTIALPLGLLFAGAIEREKRFVYLFAALLMGIALITTNSRGGIISLIAEILFLTGLTAFRKRRKQRHQHNDHKRPLAGAALRAGLALVLILGLFVGVVLTGGEEALTRFVGTVNSDDPTTGRAHFWNVTIEIIKAHPVLGTGLGAFGVVYTRYDTRNGLYRLEQAHNDYLQVLSDGGVIGAIIAVTFVILLFRVGFARRESGDEFRRGVAIGALAGCFAVLVHSFFDFTLHTTSNALLFLILAALATLDGRVEEGTSRRRRRRRSAASSDLEQPIQVAPEL